MTNSPILWWVRRDLRLADNPALAHAVATGRPVIPVFIHDELIESLGAAPKWRFGLGIAKFAESLGAVGSKLVLRRGKALDVVNALIEETGATEVVWSRAYDPDAIERDKGVKAALKDMGVAAESFAGHLMFEPWTVETKAGGFFKVYSPMWRAVKDTHVDACIAAPETLAAPKDWPKSDDLDDWQMGAAMRRGADVVAKYVCVGEAAAEARLMEFIDSAVERYKQERDFPSIEATSRLSENLTYGEIAPRRIWHAGQRAMAEGAKGAEHFCKELVWREFAYHLIFHTPHIVERNWREEWDAFNWRDDSDDAEAWRRGLTGEPMVDAAMREVYVTGTMHNRLRMIAGSHLTKHLLTDWKIGMKWFEEVLIDWDPAANAMGWQWIAGCGPDAAPYFRVFNPETQGEKFDGAGRYRGVYLHGWKDENGQSRTADFFAAIPKSWGLSEDDPRPERIVGLKEGRERALEAYSGYKSQD
ncbi:deoxyribodipyrimidine photo-lyase [Amylibacter sp. IMCC11727]|uniref:cryptochrome/photolyase family protein n=1 Tax=Amylibacter sp. IMCC11727 TaxID=3039851 RepID=UPI00244E0FB4|nr:deoxyribodipyrimidine photo-lyase [Amylibacter sp. IMCC11727]WGI20631.1 deoxyribodipyrimidine photo-lyase [Amylibacter sp. IMCC11727]